MLRFRRMDRPLNGPPGAVNLGGGSGAPSSKNNVAPTLVEFRCDVLLAIKASMPRGVKLSNFFLAYLLYDSEDELERNTFAAKVLGGRVHSVEQRIGAEFVRRAIWPEMVYFHPPRVERPRTSI
jgi:hypothetical protein